MALATAAAIRDQVCTLVEALTPVSHSGVKFKRLRNEGNGDAVEWAETRPDACFRRFQARQVGDDEPPLVSDTTTERVTLNIELRVAYPQTGKFGSDNALDRDDVMQEDRKSINEKVGLYGRGNFSSGHDCTPLPGTSSMERGNGVDYLVFQLRYEFLRDVTA